MRIRLVSLQTIGTAFGLTLATALLAAAQQTAVQPYPANGPVAALGPVVTSLADDNDSAMVIRAIDELITRAYG